MEDRPAAGPRRPRDRRGRCAEADLLLISKSAASSERDPSAPNFDPRYRFETFIVGKANEVAATAARSLATSPAVSFNPLFIHGGTGRGKTHLLRDRSPSSSRTAARGRLDVGREVHGRVHPGAEGERHDRLQAAASGTPTCC